MFFKKSTFVGESQPFEKISDYHPSFFFFFFTIDCVAAILVFEQKDERKQHRKSPCKCNCTEKKHAERSLHAAASLYSGKSVKSNTTKQMFFFCLQCQGAAEKHQHRDGNASDREHRSRLEHSSKKGQNSATLNR